jgi:hypothetical protein
MDGHASGSPPTPRSTSRTALRGRAASGTLPLSVLLLGSSVYLSYVIGRETWVVRPIRDVIAFPNPGGLGHSGIYGGQIAVTIGGRTVRDAVISAGPGEVQLDPLSHFSPPRYHPPVFRGLASGRTDPP